MTILIASIHLGWHYLADGLIGWGGMALIWWGAGAYLDRVGYPPAPDLVVVGKPVQADEGELPRLLAA